MPAAAAKLTASFAVNPVRTAYSTCPASESADSSARNAGQTFIRRDSLSRCSRVIFSPAVSTRRQPAARKNAGKTIAAKGSIT